MTPAEQLTILKNIINIPTENQNEAAMADYLTTLFAPYEQATIERYTYAPGRDNLVITIGSGHPVLVLSGHMDTVNAGDRSAWTSDPFDATIRDGNLYGRGASDMKAGLAALVVTVLEILEAGTTFQGTIKLIGTVGEETGEYGAAQVMKAGVIDDADAVLIAEPSTGFHEITYTAKGVIDYQVTAQGKAAHSARPHLGNNAIDQLFRFYNRITTAMQQFNQVDPVLGSVVHNVTVINGGEQVNTIPATAMLKGNIRTIPAYPNQAFYDVFDQIMNELAQDPQNHLTLTYSFPEEAVPGKSDSKLMQLAQQAYYDLFGFTPAAVGSLGANEAAEYIQANGDFDVICFGPGSDTSHAVDEYVPIADYQKAIAFYHHFIELFNR